MEEWRQGQEQEQKGQARGQRKGKVKQRERREDSGHNTLFIFIHACVNSMHAFQSVSTIRKPIDRDTRKTNKPLLVSNHAHQSSINQSIHPYHLRTLKESIESSQVQINPQKHRSSPTLLPNNPPRLRRPTLRKLSLALNASPARALALARVSRESDFEIRVDEAGAAFQSPADSAAVGSNGGQNRVDGQV
jgi:hypothetical protein